MIANRHILFTSDRELIEPAVLLHCVRRLLRKRQRDTCAMFLSCVPCRFSGILRRRSSAGARPPLALRFRQGCVWDGVFRRETEDACYLGTALPLFSPVRNVPIEVGVVQLRSGPVKKYLFRRKGEKHVSRVASAEHPVACTHKQHAARDCGPWCSHCPAPRT